MRLDVFERFLTQKTVEKRNDIFFEKKMWPEFSKSDFIRIINKFEKINRNFGGLNG